MYLLPDQKFFLSVLEETRFVRRNQVLPLLLLFDKGKEQRHAEAMLRQLRYYGELAQTEDGLICLPDDLRREPDEKLLLALDVLLALPAIRLNALRRGREPVKLHFILERVGEQLDSFLVMFVRPGYEWDTVELLSRQPEGQTFLLALERLEQHRLLPLARPHYFVLWESGRIRFYKGAVSGQ